MIHHLGVRASDFEASKRFYVGALRPLGVVAFYEADGVAEFGREDGFDPDGNNIEAVCKEAPA